MPKIHQTSSRTSLPKLPHRRRILDRERKRPNATGWNHFELREYDGRIGRWLSVDPARQYSSPYTAYGNNPMYYVDPDGEEGWPWIWVRYMVSDVIIGAGTSKAAIGGFVMSGVGYDNHGEVWFSARGQIGDNRSDFAIGGSLSSSQVGFYTDWDSHDFVESMEMFKFSVDVTVAGVQFGGDDEVHGRVSSVGATTGVGLAAAISSIGLSEMAFLAHNGELPSSPTYKNWEVRGIDGLNMLFMMDPNSEEFFNTNIEVFQHDDYKNGLLVSCDPVSWVKKTAESSVDESDFISIGQKYVYGIRDSCIVNGYAVKSKERAKRFVDFCNKGYRYYPNGTVLSKEPLGLYLWINDKVDIISYSEDYSFAEIRFRNPMYERKKEGRYRSLPYYTEYIPTVFLHDTTNYTLKICEPIIGTVNFDIGSRVVPDELKRYPEE